MNFSTKFTELQNHSHLFREILEEVSQRRSSGEIKLEEWSFEQWDSVMEDYLCEADWFKYQEVINNCLLTAMVAYNNNPTQLPLEYFEDIPLVFLAIYIPFFSVVSVFCQNFPGGIGQLKSMIIVCLEVLRLLCEVLNLGDYKKICLKDLKLIDWEQTQKDLNLSSELSCKISKIKESFV